MSEQVLMLGGPLHLKIWTVHEIVPVLRAPDRGEPLLSWSGAITPTLLKTIDYRLHPWRWNDGTLLSAYSCINDEYWMAEHIRIMGDQLRRISPWFGPGRLDLAMEFEKLWREVDAKLRNSDYAKNRSYSEMEQTMLKFDRLKRQILGTDE